MTNITQLNADLERDEEYVAFLYDDANDRKIQSGVTVVGNPTAGIGFALNKSPLTLAESRVILGMRSVEVDAQLQADEPWIKTIAEPRQRALSNMAYNLGVAGLLSFAQFLDYCSKGQFDLAADDLMKTPWYRQVGTRGVHIVAVIRTGVDAS